MKRSSDNTSPPTSWSSPNRFSFSQIPPGFERKPPARWQRYMESLGTKLSGFSPPGGSRIPTLILEADENQSTEAQTQSTDAIPFTPNAGPQATAYASDADVIGYGGAAGAGKSYLGLALAVTKHRKSLMLRREKTQLLDIWTKLLELANGAGRPNETYHIIRDLPGDRSVELGGVKDADDWHRYQGRAYDLYVFDEATEFLEQQVRTLMAWNRTTIPDQHCQVLLTFNPPTSSEGEWVIRFFGPWLDPQHPNPAEPGELRYFVTLPREPEEREWPDGEPFQHGDEWVTPKSRTFYPGRVTDTPQLVASGYVATLQGLPEPLRSQLLYGDFTIGMEDDQWQAIPTAWVIAAQERWRARGGISTDRLASLGVDVARGGRDFTIFAPKRGAAWVDTLITYPGVATPDGPDVAAKVFGYLIEQNARTALIVIDGIGVGASPADFLKQIPDLNIYVAIGSEKALAFDENGRQRFANTRTWFWWHVRELLDPKNGVNLCLPDDAKLRADLCAPRWKPLANGVIALETKEDLVKRLGRSPDRGDAVVLALAPVAGVNRDAVRPIHVDRAPQLSPWRQDRWRSLQVGG